MVCDKPVQRPMTLYAAIFYPRFAKLCPGWSRKLANHRYFVALSMSAYNYCKRHETWVARQPLTRNSQTYNWTIEELVKRFPETI
jgi:hypothetical protein